MLARRDEVAPPGTEPLLVPVMRAGRRLEEPEPVAVAAARLDADLDRLAPEARRLLDPTPPRVTVSSSLHRLTVDVGRSLRGAVGLPVDDAP